MKNFEFRVKLVRFKKVISEIKRAFIKNDSMPVIFDNYMGQIILMKGKVATINSLVFMTRDIPIEIPGNIGICVPDEFLNYIDKIKPKGKGEYIEFTIDNNTLYTRVETNDSHISTKYTVKIINDVKNLIPEPKTSEIENIPDLFIPGIKFCSDTIKKTKDVVPQSLVWCHGNNIFSTDERCVSTVDLTDTFFNDFALSKKSIDILSTVDIDSYAVDNRFAFFYSSKQVIGIRQYNFDTPKHFLQFTKDYQEFHKIRIPQEIIDRMPEISAMNDKKKSPDIEIIESGGRMRILSSASSKKGIKSDIIIDTNSENVVAGELDFGMFLEDLKGILKKSKVFTINEQETLLNVNIGDLDEFNYYLSLHQKVG